MIHLVSVFSNVLGALTSVNVFLHVCFLGVHKKMKLLWTLIALALAGLNFYGMRNVFSTPGMALLTVSAVLIGMDLIGLIIRIFGKTRVYAFYRKLIRCGFAFLIAAVYAAYGLINFHIVRKTQYTFENAKVPEALSVGVVSDSHMGNGMDDEKLLSVIRTVVDDGADVLVLAGDIVDENTERDMFLRFAEDMKTVRAPKGIYFVFGNHDASRWSRNITRAEMEEALTLAGVTVLT
ncbi:MAG: metallophosphoesterase, partial [Clostridia bacterium]|nr:metallophosphoesterase [Clostridia bacterium]